MKVSLDTGVLVASIKRRGEKFHNASLTLISELGSRGHQSSISIMALEELRGALASATRMPPEKVIETELSLQSALKPRILPYEDYVEKTREILLQFRDLKRKKRIPTADFHHLASAVQEKSDLFVTIDERHLLSPEAKEQLSGAIRVVNPEEALELI